jgi:hypothetical protein
LDVLLHVLDVLVLVQENVKEAVPHLVILDVMVDVKDVQDLVSVGVLEGAMVDVLGVDHVVEDVVLVVDVHLLAVWHVPEAVPDVRLVVLRTVRE